ncbi:hypothetical protein XA68_17152 [Ophiocordyceps unilateralis]|uniref:Uncharacterized protein n=1 Tax=Ophiocordyceps unilateralis TaxID=268505 RepID=A0A2A9PJ28_OPHUN|nr:hypothetical protein XA68_17152 [Ophiocordyceps unilateralis]
MPNRSLLALAEKRYRLLRDRPEPEARELDSLARAGALIGLDDENALQVLQQMIFRVSNSLLGLNYQEQKAAYSTLRATGLINRQWAQRLALAPGHTGESMFEKLFEAAINYGDEDTAILMLEMGVIADKPIRFFGEGMVASAFALAVELQCSDLLHVLITSKKTPRDAVAVALLRGDARTAWKLLDNGSDWSCETSLFYPHTQYLTCGTPLASLFIGQAALGENYDYDYDFFTSEGLDVELHEQAVEFHEQKEFATRVFERLLRCGARIIPDDMIAAAKLGRTDFIARLVQAGGNVNCSNGLGASPLSISAAGKDEPEMCQFLIELGAQINLPELEEGPARTPSPLHIACHSGNVSIVEYLVAAKADVNSRFSSPCKEVLWIEELGLHGREDLTPLQTALGFQRQEEAKKKYALAIALLDGGAQLRGGELCRSAELGDEDVVRLLLDHGAQINEKTEHMDSMKTAFQVSLDRGHAQVASILLEKGARVDDKDISFIFGVHWANRRRMLMEMLDIKTRIYARGRHGESLLEAACITGCHDEARYLLSLLAEDDYDSGALCAAVTYFVRNTYFVGNGSDSSLIDELLRRRKPELVEPLLENTAIFMAAMTQDLKLLRRLVPHKKPAAAYNLCILPIDVDDFLSDTASCVAWSRVSYNKDNPPFRLLPEIGYLGLWYRTHGRFKCSPFTFIVNGAENWREVMDVLSDCGLEPDAATLWLAQKIDISNCELHCRRP